MPGMSPRIKAKKGRFGVGGLLHTVDILSPATGSSFSLGGSPVTFPLMPFDVTGKAIDAETGDVSSTIVWTSDLDGALGTGAVVAVTLTTLGAHVITATCTVTGDVVTDTIGVTVVA